MRDLIAVVAHELTDQIRPLRGRYELPQDRAHGGFEAVPSPRQSQTGKTIVELREKRNLSEALCDQHGIGIQVKHFSHPAHHLEKYPGIFRHRPEL